MGVTHNSAEQRNQFEQDGFVVIRQFLTVSELAELTTNLDRFVHEVVPCLSAEQVFYEDRNDAASLKQIQQLGDHDPYFYELFTASRFREVAEFLLEGPVVPRNLQYFNKPPATGQPTPPHQDGYYFMLDPCHAVTMWFALDDCDQENGCVRYVRGSHKLGLRQHVRTTTLGFSQGIADYPNDHDRDHEIALPAQPGDLLVHDALTIHRADGNQSVSRSRRALGFIYYSERAREDSAAHAKYQQELAEQLKSTGRI